MLSLERKAAARAAAAQRGDDGEHGGNGSLVEELERGNGERDTKERDALRVAEKKARAERPKDVPSSEAKGGVYLPPHKLKELQRGLKSDKKDAAFQRMQWDALKKSINGLINKVNTSNIKNIIPEVFTENLVRGRGLVCRSLMKAQMASPNFTHVYAGLMAVWLWLTHSLTATILPHLSIVYLCYGH
jgi:pre-mRNA-splicing factor CWC22